MFIQGIETASMVARNQARLSGLSMGQSMERISTGLRVNHGKDDPSGLAIGAGMAAQTRGMATAIHNLQEGMNLIRTADGGLAEVHDILMRQRDVALKGANEAVQYTGTSTDPNEIKFGTTRELFNELITLDIEIYEKVRRLTFNTKQLLSGFENGQVLQGGPDNNDSNRFTVTIPDLSIMGTPVAPALPGTLTHAQFVAAFQNAIDSITDDINTISNARAELGIQGNRIIHAVGDLSQQFTNISAAKSNIVDSDMAVEMVAMAKTGLLQKSADAVNEQSFVEKGMIDTMLNAVGLDASQRVNMV